MSKNITKCSSFFIFEREEKVVSKVAKRRMVGSFRHESGMSRIKWYDLSDLGSPSHK